MFVLYFLQSLEEYENIFLLQPLGKSKASRDKALQLLGENITRALIKKRETVRKQEKTKPH